MLESTLDVNPFLITMLGYSREEFIQKKLWEVGAFKDIEVSREAIKALQMKELSLGVIMLDVDNLKRLNDTWGHAARDGILRELGSLLLKQIRGEDIPCRYGGDEFILILPDASREVTLTRAELICDQAKKFHLQYEGQSLVLVTLSLGVAVFPEHV